MKLARCHTGLLLDEPINVVEGEGGGGVGRPSPWSYFCTSGIRRDDIWQQNSQGLITFTLLLLSIHYFVLLCSATDVKNLWQLLMLILCAVKIAYLLVFVTPGHQHCLCQSPCKICYC